MTAPATPVIPIHLPAGYQARPITLDDAPTVVALINEQYQQIGIERVAQADNYLTEWKEPSFDISRSSQLISDATGKVVAYAIVWDNRPTPVRIGGQWMVQNALYDSAVSTAIVDWIERRAQLALDRCDASYKVTLNSGVYEKNTAKIEALTRAGFKHIRNFWRMLIEMDSAPPAPQLPDHITMRAMRYPDELAAVVQADRLGFKDHWGYVDQPFEHDLEEWQHFIQEDKLFDSDLYFLAIDERNGEIAGISLCRSQEWGKPEAAYVESLAVLPAYRKQGLGLAMLHYTFGEFWKRDQKIVTLHVDAASLTGATRLYEKAGMHIDETSMAYQKVLRDGVDISTTEVHG